MPSTPAALHRKKSFARSAGVVSLAVMGSRLLGLLREKVIAYFFASGVGADAIYAAFRIPNLLRDLFAEGVLSKAFITTFTETEMKDGPEAAWRLANRTLHLLGLCLGLITCIGMLAAPAIVDAMLAGPGFEIALDPALHYGFTSKRELTVFLTRIMFPFLMLVSFAALAMGMLNSKGIFGIPAWSSSFFNITALIVGVAGYYLAPVLHLHPTTGMAAGFLTGGAAQFLVQIPSLRRTGYRYRWTVSLRDPRVRQVLRLMAPMLIGAAALQVNIFANAFFASQGSGWLTWITWAFRLLHLPIGIFGVAISTVALPDLSRHTAAGNIEAFRQAFSRALRLVLFLTIPATAGLMLLSEPVSRLIFQGGAAGAEDVLQTARALFFYSLGLCGYSAVKICTDGFYAFQDTRTPVKISLFTIALNILLNYVFIMHLGLDHRSLALSTACTITINFLALAFLLRRKVGSLEGRRVTFAALRVVLATLIFAPACWWVAQWTQATWGNATLSARLAAVCLPVVTSVFLFVAACRLLKIEELNLILGAVRKRR